MTNKNVNHKTSAKQLIKIVVITLTVGILSFVPYYKTVYKDGGTNEIRAAAYVKIKWQSSFYHAGDPSGTSIYFFPFSLLPFEVLRNMETK